MGSSGAARRCGRRPIISRYSRRGGRTCRDVRRASALLLLCWVGCEGSDQPAGEIAGARRPAQVAAAQRPPSATRSARSPRRARRREADKEILFGDLHVHTTYSVDAFLFGLPLFGGEGTHPPADACDFARYCSELDFFSLNDHAEGSDAVALAAARSRACASATRARAIPRDPDLVAYVGWEWTQSGTTPDVHFGHKNVIFPGLDDAELPARPISALADDVMKRARYLWLARGAEAALSVAAPPYADFLWWIRQLAAGAALRAGRRRARPAARLHGGRRRSRRAVREARAVAPRVARDPARAHLGHPRAARRDDSRRSSRARATIRIGSGCSRSIRATARPSASTRPPRAPTTRRAAASAARPRADFLPCCWQAGEIVKSRCADPDSDACRERVEEARRLALEAGRDPQWVLPERSGRGVARLRSGARRVQIGALPAPVRERAGRRSRSRARASATRTAIRCASASA